MFQYASEALRSDREVLFAALAAYPANGYYAALNYTSGDVLDDDEIAKLALKASSQNFSYLSERLRGNKELVIAACVGSYRWVRFGSSSFCKSLPASLITLYRYMM
jgi:hypothetical protein